MRSEVLSATNFLVGLLRINKASLSELQLKQFQEYVCECMCNHYKDHWFPEKPFKGSAYRCIRINGQLDPLIERASGRMGLSPRCLYKLFPAELTMWIDPCEVSYRIGENGSICILYDQKPNNYSDTPSSTPSSSPSPKPQHVVMVSNHRPHQATSPMKLISSPAPPSLLHHHQQHIFSPSKSVVHPVHLLQQSPPPPLGMMHPNIVATNQAMVNCKESLRGSSGLESVHGLTMERRLFVSS